jgi:hypothetical protein
VNDVGAFTNLTGKRLPPIFDGQPYQMSQPHALLGLLPPIVPEQLSSVSHAKSLKDVFRG